MEILESSSPSLESSLTEILLKQMLVYVSEQFLSFCLLLLDNKVLYQLTYLQYFYLKVNWTK